jgi:hypothetical protein
MKKNGKIKQSIENNLTNFHRIIYMRKHKINDLNKAQYMENLRGS